jgi:predicted nuclease of predicted toxin-antitoxin system
VVERGSVVVAIGESGLIAQAIAEGRRLVTRDSDVLDLYAGIDGFNPLRA